MAARIADSAAAMRIAAEAAIAAQHHISDATNVKPECADADARNRWIEDDEITKTFD